MIARRKFAGAVKGVSIVGVAPGSGGAQGKVVKVPAAKPGAYLTKYPAWRTILFAQGLR